MTATFAAVFIALWVGHSFGDHWVQTDAQAKGKGAHSHAGRRACAGHVATLTLTQLAALGALVVVLDVRLPLVQLAAGLTVNAGTHYWADRRFTLAALAEHTGKGTFYRMGAPRPGHDDAPHLGTGAYALDQSWHILWLFVSALIITG